MSFVGSDLVDFWGDTSSSSKKIVDASGGDDVIIIGVGDDVVHGGQGFYFINTGAGNDTILGACIVWRGFNLNFLRSNL